MFTILTGNLHSQSVFRSDFPNIWAMGRNWVVERQLVLRLLIFLSHFLLYPELQKWSSGSLYIKFRSYGFRFCLENQGFIVLEWSMQFRSFFLKGMNWHRSKGLRLSQDVSDLLVPITMTFPFTTSKYWVSTYVYTNHTTHVPIHTYTLPLALKPVHVPELSVMETAFLLFSLIVEWKKYFNQVCDLWTV